MSLWVCCFDETFCLWLGGFWVGLLCKFVVCMFLGYVVWVGFVGWG